MKITKQFTNRESKSLDQYLQEIGKVDLLTPDMEITLAIRIKKGDMLAQEQLIKANLRFVVSVAKQFQNQGLSLGDLINEGNIGLIKAAQRFDETRGFKFISYAVWWVRQSIMQAIADQSRVVRLPLNRVGWGYRGSTALLGCEESLKIRGPAPRWPPGPYPSPFAGTSLPAPTGRSPCPLSLPTGLPCPRPPANQGLP